MIQLDDHPLRNDGILRCCCSYSYFWMLGHFVNSATKMWDEYCYEMSTIEETSTLLTETSSSPSCGSHCGGSGLVKNTGASNVRDARLLRLRSASSFVFLGISVTNGCCLFSVTFLLRSVSTCAWMRIASISSLHTWWGLVCNDLTAEIGYRFFRKMLAVYLTVNITCFLHKLIGVTMLQVNNIAPSLLCTIDSHHSDPGICHNAVMTSSAERSRQRFAAVQHWNIAVIAIDDCVVCDETMISLWFADVFASRPR